MKNRKPVVVVFILCVILLLSMYSIGACSPGNGSDPKEVVLTANKNLQKLKSYHMTIKNHMEFSLQGKNINVLTNGECDLQVKPLIMKNVMVVSTNVPKQPEQTVTQYIEQSENQLIIYSKNNEQWTKMVVPYYNPLNEYENYFKGIVSVTLINETPDLAVYEVKESAEYLKENINRAFDSIGMQNAGMGKEIFKDLGDFTYTITISKKDNIVSKMNMDLSNMMASIGVNIAEKQDIPEDKKQIIRDLFANMKMESSITLSQFNQVGPISIPPEAKKAILAAPAPTTL